MKKLTVLVLLFCLSAMASATLQLPLNRSACHPAGGVFVGPWLEATWGPGNGSTCTYYRNDVASADGTWGCSDSTTLTHIQNTKFCHCEWDYVAAIAIAVNPAPDCQPNPSTQQWWPFSYFCD